MQNANQILKERFLNFFYIPVFLILSFGLVVLCVWQYIAFGTINSPYLFAGDLYYTSGQNMFLQILNVIEFVWGIQFLRDTCKKYNIKSTTLYLAILFNHISQPKLMNREFKMDINIVDQPQDFLERILEVLQEVPF